jgi:hypothetical protein
MNDGQHLPKSTGMLRRHSNRVLHGHTTKLWDEPHTPDIRPVNRLSTSGGKSLSLTPGATLQS